MWSFSSFWSLLFLLLLIVCMFLLCANQVFFGFFNDFPKRFRHKSMCRGCVVEPKVYYFIYSGWLLFTCAFKCIFPAAVVSILLHGCNTWTLTKRLKKKLDARMLRAILNKSWRQHPTRHQLYGHLPPITKTIQVRRTRHTEHCWRSKDELISDVLLWTPAYGQAKSGRPARTYIQQLCEDTGCSQRRWVIGRSGERGSGISVLVARHDDDDDDDL